MRQQSANNQKNYNCPTKKGIEPISKNIYLILCENFGKNLNCTVLAWRKT